MNTSLCMFFNIQFADCEMIPSLKGNEHRFAKRSINDSRSICWLSMMCYGTGKGAMRMYIKDLLICKRFKIKNGSGHRFPGKAAMAKGKNLLATA